MTDRLASTTFELVAVMHPRIFEDPDRLASRPMEEAAVCEPNSRGNLEGRLRIPVLDPMLTF